MKPLKLLTILTGLLLAFSACSGPASSRGSSKYLITDEELKNVPASNALEIVQQLRPDWLLKRARRGPKSLTSDEATEPVVYLGNVKYGGIQSMRRISTENIETIRYFKGEDATIRFGTGHVGGAIQIKTKS